MRLAILFLFFIPVFSTAQSDSSFYVITDIRIKGLKRTKPFVVLRELDIKTGDTLQGHDIADRILRNRNKVFNTGLFIQAEITLEEDSALLVSVVERWYTFPNVIFELADRNFNEWWYNQGRDWRRVNTGISIVQKNVRGRNEELKATFQVGFTRKYELRYKIPYLTRKLSTGLEVTMHYSENKQIAYLSEENKQSFYSSEELLRQRAFIKASLFSRPGYYTTYLAEIQGVLYNTADSLALLNPNYLGRGLATVVLPQFRAMLTHDRRDVQAYALKGYRMQCIFDQVGIGSSIPALSFFSFTGSWYQPIIKERLFFTFLTDNKAMPLHTTVPYVLSRGPGYDNAIIRGYDLYVIEAKAHTIARSTLRFRVLNRVLHFFKKSKFTQFTLVPIGLYLNVFSDYGYAYQPQVTPQNERLMNRHLHGFGIGLDMVTYYDKVWRFEYSLNPFGDRGLYIYFTSDL